MIPGNCKDFPWQVWEGQLPSRLLIGQNEKARRHCPLWLDTQCLSTSTLSPHCPHPPIQGPEPTRALLSAPLPVSWPHVRTDAPDPRPVRPALGGNGTRGAGLLLDSCSYKYSKRFLHFLLVVLVSYAQAWQLSSLSQLSWTDINNQIYYNVTVSATKIFNAYR